MPMNRTIRMRKVLSVLLNLAIFLMVAWSVGKMILFRGTGNMQVSGAWAFIYFTVDSNVFCAAACLLAALYRAVSGKMPWWVLIFKYIGTTAVTVTLMTVLVFLGPVLGYTGMFSGINLYLHLLAPLAAILSFVFWDDERKLDQKYIWLSVLPTFLYGMVYLYQVVCVGAENGGWHDFYGFNMGGRWYVSIVAMLLATALLGAILRGLHNKMTSD